MIWIEFPEERGQKREQKKEKEKETPDHVHVEKPEYGFSEGKEDPIARDLWSLKQEVLAAQDGKDQELVDLQPERNSEGQFNFEQLPPVSYEYDV